MCGDLSYKRSENPIIVLTIHVGDSFIFFCQTEGHAVLIMNNNRNRITKPENAVILMQLY